MAASSCFKKARKKVYGLVTTVGMAKTNGDGGMYSTVIWHTLKLFGFIVPHVGKYLIFM